MLPFDSLLRSVFEAVNQDILFRYDYFSNLIPQNPSVQFLQPKHLTGLGGQNILGD